MSKHTPGPWEAHDEGCNCLFIRGQVPVNEGATSRERQYYSSIATVTQRDPHPRLGGGIDRSVTAANARLIAVSPRLLAALKATKATLERVNQERGGPIVDTIWHGPGETLFDFIDAAIQEAEGTA